jgi:transposase InsO family protein
MLAGKYQKKKKKKKTRREKCEAGACKMCYALQLSGLECDHHVPRVQWHEPLPVIFNTSGAIPKCVVKKKQVAAVFDEAKQSDNVKRAMDELAKSGKFLEIEVDAHCPDGEAVKVKARLDTASNADVVDIEKAKELKVHKVQWGGPGGRYVETANKQLVLPEGTLSVPLSIPARTIALPRRLEIDVEATIMGTVSGCDMLIGLPTLLSTGLLQAVLRKLDSDEQLNTDSQLEEDELADWEQPGRHDMPDDIVLPAKVEGSKEEQAQLWALIHEYKHLFGPAPYGGSKLRPISIQLKENVMIPRPQPARRVSPAISQDIQEDIEYKISMGWMRRAPPDFVARFASPIVAVKQPGKPKRRVCGDYRVVNSLSHQHAYPCKDTREVTAKLKGAVWLGKCDLYKGYNQVRLDEAAQELLAVRTLQGLYLPTTLPFGPLSGPSEFQSRVTHLLGELEGNGVVSYIDDLAVYSDNFAGYLQRLRALFEKLDSVDLRLNGNKCEFGVKEMEFLGHTVNKDGVRHTAKRIEAVLNLPLPENRSQLRSFLGCANFFRDSVPHLSDHTHLLSKLAGPVGKGPFKKNEWTEEHTKAFEQAKQAIGNAKMLSYLDYSKPIFCRTDASDVGAGGMLYQKKDGRDLPVAFFSRTFTATERRWSVFEKETYALTAAILQWESLLLGHHFVAEVDHRNCLWLEKSENPKVQRWRSRLSEFSFDIRHVPGRENVVADALSRCHPLIVPYPQSVSAFQEMVLPPALDPDFLKLVKAFHEQLAHTGVKSLMEKLQAAGHNHALLQQHVQFVCENCGMCQKNSAYRAADQVANQRVIRITEVGEEWSLDVVGPLPADEDGNCYILAAIDGFSRYVMLKAVKSNDSNEMAAFLLELMGIFGRPRGIRTDGGPEMDNKLIDAFMKLIGVQRHVTLAYRPQSHGKIERANREIGKHLRHICLDRRVKSSWSKYLPLVQSTMNNCTHSVIGVPPIKIVFGGAIEPDRFMWPTVIPAECKGAIEGITEGERRMIVADYIEHLVEMQKQITKTANEHQDRYLKRRVKLPTQGDSRISEFPPGSWVLSEWLGLQPGKHRPSKLAPAWRGPFQVVSVDVERQTASLMDPTDLKIVKPDVHVSMLKGYKLGLQSEAEVMRLRAMDTEEELVVQIVNHDMFQNVEEHKATGARLRTKPRKQWRFQALFADGSLKWLSWAEANQQAALDRYAEIHPELNIPES